jgi:hypothetical protein
MTKIKLRKKFNGITFIVLKKNKYIELNNDEKAT